MNRMAMILEIADKSEKLDPEQRHLFMMRVLKWVVQDIALFAISDQLEEMLAGKEQVHP